MARVVVVGSGRTAPPIAACFAAAGDEVTLAGRDPSRVADAAARAGAPVTAGTLAPATFAGADVVIESIAEETAAKHALYRSIEPALADDTLLLTNTSSLPISGLASVLERPERFAGLHFLHPADLTGPVEIIAGERTASAVIDRLRDVAARIRKVPVVARRDVPGFVWNRLQYALLRECLYLLDEGVADIESIDAAISEGLAPRWLAIGPFATADLGGIDVFRTIANDLLPHLSDVKEVPAGLEAARRRGGFYAWDDDSRAAIADLRARTLALGREIGPQRRAITPPAAD